MKIISHRGFWKSADEKNSLVAFKRSFSLGYGTETDVRDFHCNLVISHDMPCNINICFDDVLSMASDASLDRPLTLALNVKADGLAELIAKRISAYPNLDCFVFDMSVPDMRAYLAAGVPVFTRMSEVEQLPAWLDQASGVWLDAFESEWYDISDIRRILLLNKRVCVVSPELHGRPHETLWSNLLPLVDEPNLLLCTDLPEEANELLNFHRGKSYDN